MFGEGVGRAALMTVARFSQAALTMQGVTSGTWLWSGRGHTGGQACVIALFTEPPLSQGQNKVRLRTASIASWRHRFMSIANQCAATPSDRATSWGLGMYEKCCKRRPYQPCTRKKQHTGTASLMPGDTPRGLQDCDQACAKFLEYKRQHNRGTLPPNQADGLRTNSKPHQHHSGLPVRLSA